MTPARLRRKRPAEAGHAAESAEVREYRWLEGIGDVRAAAFVLLSGRPDAALESVVAHFGTERRIFLSAEEARESLMADPADVAFVGPWDAEFQETKFALCRALRDSGYRGVLVLMVDDAAQAGGILGITAEGFDNYLAADGLDARLEDSVNWAITNRRRKNKSMIQFDHNPDAFFTVDARGRVYDINTRALAGLGLTPRGVVVGAMNVVELGTLNSFSAVIRPLIVAGNVGRTFSHTVYEGSRIFQLKTRVHNVVTLGLAATVVKTDITLAIYSRTMDILMNSITLLSQRDNYTAGHSSRVYAYARLIAGEIGLGANRKFLRDLYFASLLHDIGKIGVRDNILRKPGKLTAQEFRELSTHSVKGFRMLSRDEFLRDCAGVVLAHHERPDGRGYPGKLRSSRIPKGAAIIAVADGFDAMTSNRPYRRSLGYDLAVAELQANAGTQFDREAARAFISVLRPELVGEIRRASLRPLEAISAELLETIAAD